MALPRLLFLSSNIQVLSFAASAAKTRCDSTTSASFRTRKLKFSSTARRGGRAVISGSSSVAAGDDLPEDYGSKFPSADPNGRRRAGVLLHPSSLRGPYGIGDFGDEAIRFLDWLHSTGCSVWQVLPLVPPGRKSNEDGSPYAGQDANCGNTLLISLEELVKDGLLTEDELPEPMDAEKVQFATVAKLKDPLIAKAAERLTLSQGDLKLQFESFCKDPTISCWLEDAALFSAIDHVINTFSWDEWPDPLKNRHLGALEDVQQSNKEFIYIFIAQQFLFQKQWKKIRSHAHELGITIIGDMPIYVGHHSADVWANKRSFLLDREGFPILVSGVPPDAFSETGQLWGSPLYDWRSMEDSGYTWWIQRIKRALDLYDEFRIDHFRGLAGFWAVPSEAKVAMFGRWKAGPGQAFFDAIFRAVGKINIIAEDLGVITEDVIQLRKSIGAPGMAVLQFGNLSLAIKMICAGDVYHGILSHRYHPLWLQSKSNSIANMSCSLAFGGGTDNPHSPHNHELDQVVYTGTHDNDTALGWWEGLKEEEKYNVHKYLQMSGEAKISWVLIHAAVSSVARTAIMPMQDILGLGSSARMNTPATQFGNWNWRIPSGLSFDKLEPEAHRIRDLLSLYNRL